MLSELGPYYDDMIEIEAWLKGRPVATEAASLLCAKLQERTETRNAMLDHEAAKRGVSRDELIQMILNGKV